MKSKLLLMTLALASFSAMADSKFSAEQVCAKNKTEVYKADCYYTVDKAWYFDEEAVKICQTLVYDTFRNDCLFIAADKKYDAVEIKKCNVQVSLNAIINDTTALDCIYDTPSKHFLAK